MESGMNVSDFAKTILVEHSNRDPVCARSHAYPAFTTVLPARKRIRIPAAYALPRGETEWGKFVDNWVDLKQKDGTVQENYQFWMAGGATKTSRPRWSIIRDVLGWVD